MKLLVISQQIGASAPGIVFERLLSELTKHASIEVDIVTCEYNPSLDIKANNVQVISYPTLHYRVSNFMNSIFWRDWISEILKYRIRLKHNDYDVILSLCSSGHMFGLVSGIYLRGKIGCKLACYLVDAVPAPIGWSKNDRLYRSTLKMIGSLLSKVDMIASVNQEMLNYQLKTFKHKEGLISTVLLPSSVVNKVSNIPYTHEGVYRFLYTGNIYGLRSSKYIIKAFSLLLKEREDIELYFVGNTGEDVRNELHKYGEKVRKHVVVYPRVSDLKPFYSKASALIDIDADIDNDVFLSSKMSSYLTIDRPIICETGLNSPSRNLFKNLSSIIQCNHDPEELYNAMRFIIDTYRKLDYTDRNHILCVQSSVNVAKLLLENLRDMINDKISIS